MLYFWSDCQLAVVRVTTVILYFVQFQHWPVEHLKASPRQPPSCFRMLGSARLNLLPSYLEGKRFFKNKSFFMMKIQNIPMQNESLGPESYFRLIKPSKSQVNSKRASKNCRGRQLQWRKTDFVNGRFYGSSWELKNIFPRYWII